MATTHSVTAQAATTGATVTSRASHVHTCGEFQGQLSNRAARAVLDTEHHPTCSTWLAAVAFLSAELDDDN